MRNVWIIARREYKSFFLSPVAYAVAFVFMLVLGYSFFRELYQAITQAAFQNYVPNVQFIIYWIFTLLWIVLPAVTMRSIAEEMRSGTMELLLTAPVKDWELVVGKWLGVFFFVISLLAITFIFPIILNSMVKPGIDPGILFSGYLGLILIVASLTAIGVFISSMVSNQVVVFVITFVVVIILLLVNPSSSASAGTGNQLLSYLNFISHFSQTFFQGTISVSDIVYYLSLTSLALFLGTAAVEMRRWR